MAKAERVAFLKENTKEISFEHDRHMNQIMRQAGISPVAAPADCIPFIVDFWADCDPTPKGIYVNWIVNQYRKKNSLAEDRDLIVELLNTFDRVKKQKGALKKNDIGQYADPGELRLALQPFTEADLRSKREKEREAIEEARRTGVALVFENENIRIERPLNAAVSNLLYRDTAWCTARDGNLHFRGYFNQGPLFVLLAGSEKWQFHFPSNQFHNSDNRRINVEEFVARFPELRTIPEFKGETEIHLPFLNNTETNELLEKWVAGTNISTKIIAATKATPELAEKIIGKKFKEWQILMALALNVANQEILKGLAKSGSPITQEIAQYRLDQEFNLNSDSLSFIPETIERGSTDHLRAIWSAYQHHFQEAHKATKKGYGIHVNGIQYGSYIRGFCLQEWHRIKVARLQAEFAEHFDAANQQDLNNFKTATFVKAISKGQIKAKARR